MPRNPDKTDYTQGFPASFRSFEMIKDSRSGGNTLHHFGEIIFVAFTCILCCVKSYELMQEFCEIRLNWFHKWISLPNGVPAAFRKNNSAPPKTKPTSNNASP